jgi:Sulfotransferase family
MGFVIPSSPNGSVQKTPFFTLFSTSPSEFVTTLLDCMDSDNCHVLYHHIQKTGGSHVASRLFPVFEERSYNSSEWCCNEKFLTERFRQNPQDYCSRKMSIYEIKTDDFAEIHQICHDIYPSRKFVTLISIREPIQRTLSMIHHQCNKNFDLKNPYEQAMCLKCAYVNDSIPFWDSFVRQTNTLYANLMDVMQHRNLRLKHLGRKMPIWLILDNLMIDPFFDLIESSLSEKTMKGRWNKEQTKICNFGMPSIMMKNLLPAQAVYSGLAGGYLPQYPL